ncbi:MAG: hypothetical protein Q8916_13885 [Bacteroidota bacterium]|nr:hypothetical protein [Bacteroidota bacterium]
MISLYACRSFHSRRAPFEMTTYTSLVAASATPPTTLSFRPER